MANRLLASLPESELALLEPQLEPVTLENRSVLQEPYAPFSHLYFVTSGLVSVLTVMADRATVETALVGNEGVAGIEIFLGANHSTTREIVQMPDESFRLSREQLQELLPQMPALEAALRKYAHFRLSMACQLAACNRLHSVSERCALWLLQVHDRVERDEFDLTHEFMACMLGVRRAGVTQATGRFLAAGLLHYSRGHVRILDRQGLENQACERNTRLRQHRLSILS